MADSSPDTLVIETSGATGGVAVACGDRLLAAATLATTSRHAADLLGVADRLWREAGGAPGRVATCCLSIGPGSFTGLRVAVTVARSLALACGTRIVAVPTLAVIAEEARSHLAEGEHVAVLLDAKRAQVFGAVFRRDGDCMTPLSEAALHDPATLLAATPRPCRITGEGVAYHAAACLASRLPLIPEPDRMPRPRGVHRLARRLIAAGQFADPAILTPLYVRRPEAEEIWERRQGAAPA